MKNRDNKEDTEGEREKRWIIGESVEIPDGKSDSIARLNDKTIKEN